MTQQRSINTQEQIMAAAVDLFCRLGYDAAGVAEICAQAGVSKGAFYHHFPSKKALFLAIMDQWLDGINLQLSAMRETGKPVSKSLRDMADAVGSIFSVASGQLPMFMEFMVQASRDQAVWDASIAPYQAYQTRFVQMLKEGKTDGSIQPEIDEQAAAWVLIAFAVGVLLQGIVLPDRADWKDITQIGMGMIVDGLQRSNK
jgi:AcrR family transcriptional regulator